MMLGISGTPGCGKSTVAGVLASRGHRIVQVTDTVADYIIGDDDERDTQVVDVDAWAEDFKPVDGIVEGHMAHFLPCDRLVLLRCRPDILSERLRLRGYHEEKVQENAEAEALDVILVEALENLPPEKILELDATSASPEELAVMIEEFMSGERPPSHGSFDWSSYLVP